MLGCMESEKQCLFLEKKQINSPFNIIFSTCAFLLGYTLDDTHKVIKEGVDLMVKTTLRLAGNV
jgi:hypothetical protein